MQCYYGVEWIYGRGVSTESPLETERKLGKTRPCYRIVGFSSRATLREWIHGGSAYTTQGPYRETVQDLSLGWERRGLRQAMAEARRNLEYAVADR